MSFTKKLFSRRFFLINLVLIGIMLGFGSAFLVFTSLGNGRSGSRVEVDAETRPEPEASTAQAISTAESLQLAFNYVANTVLPSVVELQVLITSQGASPADQQLPWRFFFGDPGEGGEIPSIPDQESEGLGSGVIVRKTGRTAYILTNAHVVQSASEILVRLFDEDEYEGKIIGIDERRDLALVSFETNRTDIRVALLGNSDAIKIGDWTVAVGSPFGLFSSVTIGVISAVGRDGGPDGNISDFIQTDAAINRGNSGGALANIKGEIIGINTWIASPSGGSIGLGFSIPINNTKRVIDDLIAHGSVRYGWLGVLLQTLERDSLASLGIPDSARGAMVGSLFSTGPAAKSGMLPGDFVTAIDGRRISSTEQLVRIVGDLPAGTESVFQLIRNGRSLEVRVSIEERLSNQDYSFLWPGLEVAALSQETRNRLRLDTEISGVVLLSVLPRTPAAVLALQPGDIITAINGVSIRSILDFYVQLNNPRSTEVRFTVYRDGQSVSTLAIVRK
ncbi:MAG: hypothetical protein A2087_00700 [Spirochaetes bacterium GWD1_61_31]|nr:MAG: hypothetical protein A2Y37_03125 [Spirochaetes bacterium GWB1_60_80]OHD29604.1 MAG: hypothetical protein A2004_01665 [Spirochaetes bacterium GWC1_61_12]OHD37507.1 MAG: hypothetical protein A2087_00700 [Spirochaetes bacterium GWD1_61_31]OHD41983.1 MAG: hypothetical protein A2Y35_14565 [Spirochaetes bacterium GWE1_60_18]OHD61751.1 MAG: hypothetical protein A2Y32_13385 [Spirochaetes bacterium GWF1_60_12]